MQLATRSLVGTRPAQPLTRANILPLDCVSSRKKIAKLARAASSSTDVASVSRSSFSTSSAPSSNTSVLPPSELDPAARRKWVMEETCTFLRSDLEKIFNTGDITPSRYDPNIRFEDPITSATDLNGYMLNMKLLKTLFNITFDLHSIKVTGENEVTARWTMGLRFWLLPWRPDLEFTGTSHYKVNPDTGIILAHLDVWDAIKHNKFMSLEGLQHVLRMFADLQLTPEIETHKYSLLRKFRDYELRHYPNYLVAETALPAGSGPATGKGFNELAGYIFGSNKEGVKMGMTSPVVSVVPPGQQQSTSMQFVMESRFQNVSALPTPSDPKIVRREERGGYFAAVRFSGWPLDWEVVANERQLRSWLQRDGYTPKPGYLLARYNEPTVPPFLRRNEVLIELADFKWPQ